MPRTTRNHLMIWGAFLLSVSLVSCSSPVHQPTSGQPSNPPSLFTPEQTLTQAPTPVGENIDRAIAEPSKEPKAASPALPEKESNSSPPAVEVSTLNPIPKKEEVIAPEPAFNSASPSLAGILLDASEKDVYTRFGLPIATYDLPGEMQPIEIWEYDGFSIGLNSDHAVVYVEIISNKVNTGILGLSNGMNGSQAAQLLGVPSDAQTNVITVEVKGGWFKLDLDPDSQTVLSMKLLSKKI